ncbi:hypothetical protein ES703_96746 [subsurface metagenome]
MIFHLGDFVSFLEDFVPSCVLMKIKLSIYKEKNRVLEFSNNKQHI